MKRLLSGATVAAAAAILCFAAPAPARHAALLLAALYACREAVRLAGAAFVDRAETGSRPPNLFFPDFVFTAALVLLAASLGATASFLPLRPESPESVAAIALVLVGLLALTLPRTPAGFSRLGAVVLAGCWIGLPTAAILALSAGETGGRTLFFLFATVMSGEAGAFAVGKLVGGPLLAPRLSPGKTWVGFAAQLIVSAAVAGLAAPLLDPRPPGLAAATAGACLAAAAALGDLFESYWKRASGLKDSGRLLPGHGGMLDRVDGMLFAAVAFEAVRGFLPG